MTHQVPALVAVEQLESAAVRWLAMQHLLFDAAHFHPQSLLAADIIAARGDRTQA